MNRNNDIELVAGGARRLRHERRRSGWKPILGCDDIRPGMSGDEIGASTAQQVATVALTHDPKVQAGMMLLRASKRNPRARRKVLRIARRADAGDPKAVAAMQTLRTAKAVEKSNANANAKKASRKQRLVLPAASAPGAATVTVTATVTRKDPFHHWKKGSG